MTNSRRKNCLNCYEIRKREKHDYYQQYSALNHFLYELKETMTLTLFHLGTHPASYPVEHIRLLVPCSYVLLQRLNMLENWSNDLSSEVDLLLLDYAFCLWKQPNEQQEKHSDSLPHKTLEMLGLTFLGRGARWEEKRNLYLLWELC